MKKIINNRIMKYYIFCIMLIMMCASKAFSYSESTVYVFDSPSSSGINECRNSITYNQTMTLKNVKIKFTQDDDEYKFRVTAESDCDVKKTFGEGKPNYYDTMVPFLYKTENFGADLFIQENYIRPYSQFYGFVSESEMLKIKKATIATNTYNYTIKSSGDVIINEATNTDNGDKYFIPLSARPHDTAQEISYRNSRQFPTSLSNNGDGVTLVNNASYLDYDTYISGDETRANSVSASIDVTIAIEKEYIDDYRYICFACYGIIGTYGYQSGNVWRSGGYSVSTNTIDLKNYITCNHVWSVSESDSDTHTLVCANCEWSKNEEHVFKFEYDGISNDVCICSRVKKVYYHYEINDDSTTCVDKLLNVNSTCDKVTVNKKTGYNFLWYEKYEISINDTNLLNLTSNKLSTTKTFVANTTSIDNNTGSRSVYYKAIYTPIKYVFNYSNKTNLADYIDKKLNKSSEITPQTFYYNKKDNLKSNINYDFLTFKGWTFIEGGDKVDFAANAEVYNYTTIDLKNYTIYPVYVAQNYKILYNTVQGKFENGMQQASKKYDYYIDEDFIKPSEMGKDKVFSHYVDMYGNIFYNMNELRNHIKDDVLEEGEEHVVILFATSKKGSTTVTTSTGDKTDASGNGSEVIDGTNGNSSTNNTDNINNANVTDVINNESVNSNSLADENNVSIINDSNNNVLDDANKISDYVSKTPDSDTNNNDANNVNTNISKDNNTNNNNSNNNNSSSTTTNNNGSNNNQNTKASNGNIARNKTTSSSDGSSNGSSRGENTNIISNGMIINGSLTANNVNNVKDSNELNSDIVNEKKNMVLKSNETDTQTLNEKTISNQSAKKEAIDKIKKSISNKKEKTSKEREEKTYEATKSELLATKSEITATESEIRATESEIATISDIDDNTFESIEEDNDKSEIDVDENNTLINRNILITIGIIMLLALGIYEYFAIRFIKKKKS